MDIPEKFGIPAHEFRVVFGGTKIDYDLDKEKENRKNHGYSLESAVHILKRLVFPSLSPRPHFYIDVSRKGEIRHKHLTVDDSDNVVVMVTTMRPEETVRVISFRRASEDERKEFELLKPTTPNK